MEIGRALYRFSTDGYEMADYTGGIILGTEVLCERYKKPIYITENGLASPDMIAADGKYMMKTELPFWISTFIITGRQAMKIYR